MLAEGVESLPHLRGREGGGAGFPVGVSSLDVFVPSSAYLTNEDSHMCCALCDGRSGYPLKWPRFTSDE